MLWKGRRQSSNIEDRRGAGGGMGGLGGGLGGGFGGGRIGGGRIGGGGLGIGGIIILFIIAWVLGINPLTLLSGGGMDSGGYVDTGQNAAPTYSSQQEDEMKQFVSTVLADTEDTWNQLLPQQYRNPKLVLFSGGVDSACGFAQSAVGPFYCPGDEKVYLDLDFFAELSQRFGAPGDFAQAYVIAHEIGHHVQNVLGIEQQVSKARSSMSETQGNALSVRVELQADCFAGVWANRANKEGVVEPGDIDEALTAASAVGDDTLQKQATGQVVPDSFTHGSAEQRSRWFQTGYRSGDANDCDTLNAKNL